jgi:hypothetical protein
MPVSILELKSSAKGDFTAEAQISQRKIVYCPTQTYASLHIEPHFVSGILCTLSVSAVHYSHTMQTAPPPIWRRGRLPRCDSGAGDGTRTRTGLPPSVFKTEASAVPPLRQCMIYLNIVWRSGKRIRGSGNRAIAISTAKTPIGRILLRLMLKPGEVQRTILDFFS